MTTPDVPADSGHLWLVRVEGLLGSSIVTGDAHHRDAPVFGDRPFGLRVRAWSMSEALEVAAGIDFVEWYVRDEQGRFCGMVAADGAVAPTPEGKSGYCGPRCQHCIPDDGRPPVYALNADGVWACHADSDLMDREP